MHSRKTAKIFKGPLVSLIRFMDEILALIFSVFLGELGG